MMYEAKAVTIPVGENNAIAAIGITSTETTTSDNTGETTVPLNSTVTRDNFKPPCPPLNMDEFGDVIVDNEDDYYEFVWTKSTTYTFILSVTMFFMLLSTLFFNMWEFSTIYFAMDFNLSKINWESSSPSFANNFIDGPKEYDAWLTFGLFFPVFIITMAFAISHVNKDSGHGILICQVAKNPTLYILIITLFAIVLSEGIITEEYHKLGEYIPYFDDYWRTEFLRFYSFIIGTKSAMIFAFFTLMDDKITKLSDEFTTVKLLPQAILILLSLVITLQFLQNFIQFYTVSHYLEGASKWYDEIYPDDNLSGDEITKSVKTSIYNGYVSISSEHIVVIEFFDLAIDLVAHQLKKNVVRKDANEKRSDAQFLKKWNRCGISFYLGMLMLFIVVTTAVGYCIRHSIIDGTYNTTFVKYYSNETYTVTYTELAYSANLDDNATTVGIVLVIANLIALVSLVISKFTFYRKGRGESHNMILGVFLIIILVAADWCSSLSLKDTEKFWFLEGVCDLTGYLSQLLFFDIAHKTVKNPGWMWTFLVFKIGCMIAILVNISETEKEESLELNNVSPAEFVAGIFQIILEVHIIKCIFTAIFDDDDDDE